MFMRLYYLYNRNKLMDDWFIIGEIYRWTIKNSFKLYWRRD